MCGKGTVVRCSRIRSDSSEWESSIIEYGYEPMRGDYFGDFTRKLVKKGRKEETVYFSLHIDLLWHRWHLFFLAWKRDMKLGMEGILTIL